MHPLLVRLGNWLRGASAPKTATPHPDAVAANQRGLDARSAGDLEGAIAAHRDATYLDPGWEAPWFNLGVACKLAGRWQECASACRRAHELDPSFQGSLWNLGIACTALGDWVGARAAWRACGLSIPDGEGPLELAYGPVPIRLDPSDRGEVVWCDRIDPARARIQNIPLPESGRRWGDLLLHDGAPNGYRKLGDQEVPVFDELALLAPSGLSTFVVETEQATPEDAAALQATFAARKLPSEDWTVAVRPLCKACSEGRPHEASETHEPVASSWATTHRVAVAARAVDAVRAALAEWVAAGPNRSHGEVELALDGGDALPSASTAWSPTLGELGPDCDGMRIEFIAEGSAECPLLLITCRRPQAAATLAVTLLRTSAGPVEVHRLPGIEAADGVTLVVRAAPTDLGVRRGSGKDFEWALSQEGWEEVVELLEPFAEPVRAGDGFQFLNRHDGPNVIISTNGRW